MINQIKMVEKKLSKHTLNRSLLKKCAVLTLAVSLCIPVSGCGKSSENAIVPEGATDAEEAAKVEQKELTPESIVVSVGDSVATYKELLVYRYILKDKYQDTLGEGIWNYEIEPGKTFGDITTAQVVGMITQMKVIGQQAKSLGISLTGDEIQNIRQYVEKLFQSMTEQDIAAYNLDVDTMTNVYCENEIAARVYDSCINGINTSISDDDARQCKVWYIYLQTSGVNQSGVEVNLNEEEINERYKEAKKLRKKAKTVEDFLSFAEANTESASAEAVVGRGDMSDEFINACFALNNGEFSPVVTAPEGFYIIYCVEANDEEKAIAKKEELVAKEQKEKFEQLYAEWAKKYEVQISDLII